MVIKKKFRKESTSDPRLSAGNAAEAQMAFYLKRAFGESEDVFVYNDLRFERNGEVAQIDHLLLHRYGFTLIESKSVTGRMEVNRQLEFVRTSGRRRQGIKSPITQVAMQAELLRKLLNDHKEDLRRRVMTVTGRVQGAFGDHRFDLIVAIADRGEIVRKQCDPPELMKADRVAEVVKQAITKKDEVRGVGGFLRYAMADKHKAKELDEHNVVEFTADEMLKIHEFLKQHHTKAKPSRAPASPDSQPRLGRRKRPTAARIGSKESGPVIPPPLPGERTPLRATQPEHTCRKCDSSHLSIQYSKRLGYYFLCDECKESASISVTCGHCNAKARISKRGLDFTKKCTQCEYSEHFFANSK